MSDNTDYVEKYGDDQEFQHPDGTNDQSSVATFLERSIYKNGSYPIAFVPEPIDLWSRERHLYGKVDPGNNAVYPDILMTREIGDEYEDAETRFLLDFVAEAFEEFRKDYHLHQTAGRIAQPNETSYGDLEPTKGWVDAEILYADYLQERLEYFNTQYLPNSRFSKFNTSIFEKGITHFHEYVMAFSKYAQSLKAQNPFTMCGFIKSQWCSPMISGLMVDVADEDHGDDAIKFEDYILDPNFVFVTRFAQKHGFKVDKNAPWRFVADLKSPAWRKYLIKYNIANFDQIFLKKYKKAYIGELDILKEKLLNSYRSYVLEDPYYRKIETSFDCGSTSMLTPKLKISFKNFKKIMTTPLELEKKYTNLYWQDFYVRLRLMMIGDKNARHYNSIIKNVRLLQKVLDKEQILRYINNRIVSCVKMKSDQTSARQPSGFMELQEVTQGPSAIAGGMSSY